MSDNWKILRGGGEAPQKDTAPIEENAGREEEHVDRYGDPVNDSPTVSPAKKREDWPTEAVPTAEQSVPKKHFVIGLCVLVLVFFGWIFRQEVRGVFSWAMAKVQGHDVPLSSKAPGLGDAFRFGKEYTMEEFLTVCTDGTVASVAKILEKQPALLEPKDGTTILHLVSARSINPEIFGLILKRVGRDAVNARDSQGRTPLHIAAVSPVPAGFILAFRGNGANVIVHDNEGKTPVEYAKKMGVSPAIITLLGKMPVYEPSEPPDKSPEKSPGEQPKEEKPATEKQKNLARLLRGTASR